MNIENVGSYISQYQAGGKIAVLTDENVGGLYLNTVADSLHKAGFAGVAIIIPATEECKSAEMYMEVINKLAAEGFTRSDGILSLGGGVINDLAGFVAATFMRGINLYSIPTSLMSMVDASIGGKNAINLPTAKNMIGSFYEPLFVLRDISVLKSLASDVFAEGIAEVIKYAMVADAVLFDILEAAASSDCLLNNTGEYDSMLQTVIDKCVEIKALLVSEDPYDFNTRNLLNFGHTIGHAIEVLSGYSISHGCAVAKGMDRITEIAVAHGWCDSMIYERLHDLLTAYGYDLSIEYSMEDIAKTISSDKKRRGDEIALIIPEEIGQCTIKRVALSDLLDLINIK